jgi:hypothetical protein
VVGSAEFHGFYAIEAIDIQGTKRARKDGHMATLEITRPMQVNTSTHLA